MELNTVHPPRRPAPYLRACLLILMLLFTGCAGQQPLFTPLDEAFDDNSTEKAAEALLASDQRGPLPKPHIPPELSAAAPSSPTKTGTSGGSDRQEAPVVRYTVQCESPEAPELAQSFLSGSTLTRMQNTPLYSVPGLEQRLKTSLQEGHNILHSFGYYAGSVHGALQREPAPTGEDAGSAPEGGTKESGGAANSSSIAVTVTFESGPQYHVGKTQIIRADLEARSALPPPHSASPSLSSSSPLPPSPVDAPALPASLQDVGLAPEAPAVADTVLAAVDRAKEAFRNRGYPEAQVISSRFFLRHEERLLDADIRILPGPFMRMGPVSVQGECIVSSAYLKAKQTWNVGDPWEQNKVDAYRDALRQTGLFLSIDLDPAEKEDAAGNRPVLVTVHSAPERTVGGAIKYDTSFGPGLQAYWEHRNLTGRGDSLRLELPVWADMQELTAKYRLPYFLRTDQDFIAQAGLLNQDLDAYSLQAGRVAAGIERRLSRHWSLTVQGSAEGGSLKDPEKPRTDYMMYGLPASLSFDSTNSLLDATQGGRAVLSLAPYNGEYNGNFTVLRSRADVQRFDSLIGENTLVLALRGSLGTLTGTDARDVPPSVRFYSGGGGSVRGYEYQSLGPRNDNDDPLGGSTLLEVGIEPRLRLSEEWGLVAFLDGGMAYEDFGDLGRDLQWGAGLGVRFYTAIGPMRIDVATPLNPRDDDAPMQFYISIGQSF